MEAGVEFVSAPTVAEIQLPNWIFTNNYKVYVDMDESPMSESKNFELMEAITKPDATEADTRARILIYLKKNNLI